MRIRIGYNAQPTLEVLLFGQIRRFDNNSGQTLVLTWWGKKQWCIFLIKSFRKTLHCTQSLMRLNQFSKFFFQPASDTSFMASSNLASASSGDENCIPLSWFFVLRNRKKWHSAKSGRVTQKFNWYTYLLSRNILVLSAECTRALSWCQHQNLPCSSQSFNFDKRWFDFKQPNRRRRFVTESYW